MCPFLQLGPLDSRHTHLRTSCLRPLVGRCPVLVTLGLHLRRSGLALTVVFRIFAYQPGPGTSSSDFLSRAVRALSYREYAATLCSASPAIPDISYMGQDCRAVVVLTERLPCVPVPPGRVCVPQHVIFLDRRAILLDLTWVIADRGLLDFDLLTAEYERDRPPGFTLIVKGGQHQSRDGHTYVFVEHRGTLKFEFIRDLLSGRSAFPDSDEDSGQPDEDAESSDSTSDPSLHGGQAMLLHGLRDRSRSSRGGGRFVQDFTPAGPLWEVPVSKPLRLDPVAILLALFSDVSASKPQKKGSVCNLGLAKVAVSTFDWPSLCSGHKPAWPPHESARPSLRVCPAGEPEGHNEPPASAPAPAHTPTLAAPTGVSGDSGSGFHDDEPTQGGDRPGQDRATDGSVTFADAHFLVLAPDSVPEMLHIRLPVPISEDLAFGMIDGARDPLCRDRFPRLCPVYPQPWGQAALVLAAPFWGFSGILVAFDLSAINGAFFSLVIARQVTKEMVLRAAGLDPAADVALFMRDVPWAIPAGFTFV